MRSLKSTTTASTVVVTSSNSASAAPAAAEAMQRSPWHSPVPYLFGGLAAMLGLIAFALLILACSYWKQMNNGEDLESGDGDGDDDDEKKKKKGGGRVVYEEQFVVILAGDDMPTCLAMPVCSRAKLFSNESDGCNSGDEKAGDQSVKEDFEEEYKHQGGGEESNMSSEQSQELHLHHETDQQ